MVNKVKNIDGICHFILHNGGPYAATAGANKIVAAYFLVCKAKGK